MADNPLSAAEEKELDHYETLDDSLVRIPFLASVLGKAKDFETKSYLWLKMALSAVNKHPVLECFERKDFLQGMQNEFSSKDKKHRYIARIRMEQFYNHFPLERKIRFAELMIKFLDNGLRESFFGTPFKQRWDIYHSSKPLNDYLLILFHLVASTNDTKLKLKFLIAAAQLRTRAPEHLIALSKIIYQLNQKAPEKGDEIIAAVDTIVKNNTKKAAYMVRISAHLNSLISVFAEKGGIVNEVFYAELRESILTGINKYLTRKRWTYPLSNVGAETKGIRFAKHSRFVLEAADTPSRVFYEYVTIFGPTLQNVESTLLARYVQNEISKNPKALALAEHINTDPKRYSHYPDDSVESIFSEGEGDGPCHVADDELIPENENPQLDELLAEGAATPIKRRVSINQN